MSPGPSSSRVRSVATHDREDAQQVGVDPHQADGHGEGGTPALTLRDAVGDTLLDEVEVEDQHEDTEREPDDREHQAQATHAEEAELGTEEAQHDLDQADRDDTEHGREDHLAE